MKFLKRVARFLPLMAAVVIGLGLVYPALAYDLMATDGFDNYWSQPIDWYVDADNQPKTTEVWNAMFNAFQAWQSLPDSHIVFQYRGLSRDPLKNLFSFKGRPGSIQGRDAIADCPPIWGVVGDQQPTLRFHCNMVSDYTGTPWETYSYFQDLMQEVMTHELGHGLGFAHTTVSPAMMDASLNLSGADTTIYPDDAAAAHDMYPEGNIKPIARLSVSSAHSLPGAAVVLDASASSDSDGSIVQYKFHFGDGTPDLATSFPTVAYTYSVPPTTTHTTFYPNVMVTDDKGGVDYVADKGPTVNIGTDISPPAAPTGLFVAPTGPLRATLSWNPVVDTDPLTYKVYRSSSSGGNYSFLTFGFGSATLRPPDSATYYYVVTAVDSAQNESPFSAELAYAAQTDTVPPTVSLTAPTNGSTVTGNAVEITANATDNVLPFGGIGGGGVTFLLDGVPLVPENNGYSPYSLTWDTTGVTPGTHQLTARARDSSGNLSSSSVTVTVVHSVPDIVSPNVSGVTVNPSQTGATFSWTTNEPATSQIEYGVFNTSAMVWTYITSTQDNSLVTSHTQTISGLSSATGYNYRVRSFDAAGNYGVSPNSTFSTLGGDNVGPVFLSSSLVYRAQNCGYAVWSTNELATGKIEFGSSTAYGQLIIDYSLPALATNHTLYVCDLNPNTTYHFRIKATDASGNFSVSSDFSLTIPLDITPPPLGSPSVTNISQSAADIIWNTTELSDSQVEYGLTSAYGQSTSVNSAGIDVHDLALSGLSANTVYHYRVKSKDSSGNLATSADYTFTTLSNLANSPVISAVAVTGITANSATFTWSTNNTSTSQVEWGPTLSYGSLLGDGAFVFNHSVSVGNLSPNTTFHYHVKSADSSGNSSVSADYTFTTPAAAVSAPVISAISAGSLTQSSAMISWTTDKAADTQVDYGTTAAYGQTSALNSSLVTSHSQSLSGLTAGTTYHYRVKSKDSSGNLTISGDFTFNTTAVSAPPVISAVATSGIAQNSASIGWSTDKLADSQVEYGLTISYGQTTVLDTSMLYGHNETLNGLSSNTTYHYRVKSKDSSGNLATSGDYTFTTIGAVSPPVISGVSASPSQTSAVVNWSTDKLSDSQVEYGLTAAYGQTAVLNSSLVTYHSQNLSGLAAGTTYHYRVKSKDSSGNLATSNDFTFTTTVAPDVTPPVISGVSPSNLTPTSVAINWNTNEPATGQIDYGTTIGYGQTTGLFSTLFTNHYPTISGLNPATLYHYRIKSADASGNLATSPDYTFTTPAAADITPPVISGTSATNLTSNSATIIWNTDELSDSQIDYGQTSYYGMVTTLDSNSTLSHSQSLSNLLPTTTYHYRVRSRDSSGNQAVSPDYTFTTSLATVNLSISGITASNINQSSALVIWYTNINADGKVEYGTTPSYGQATAVNSSLLLTHTQSLSNLVPGTTYHFRVISSAGSATAISPDQTLATQAIPGTPTPTTSPTPVQSNPNRVLTIIPPKNNVFVRGSTYGFSYRIWNDGYQTMNIAVSQELVSNSRTINKSMTAKRIRARSSIVVKSKEKLSLNLNPGTYLETIKLFDDRGRKVSSVSSKIIVKTN